MRKDDWIILSVLLSFLCGFFTLATAMHDMNPGRYYWLWSDSWFGLLRDLHNEYNNCWTLLFKTFGIFFFVCVAFFWWLPFGILLYLAASCIAFSVNKVLEEIEEIRKIKKETDESISGTDDSI